MAQPIISRFFEVVADHRKILILPKSVSGRLTVTLAKVLVFPQTLAPALILFGAPVIDVMLISVARCMAMHLVWLLDRHIPYTRALRLCHLVTFGPLFVYFAIYFNKMNTAWGSLAPIFLFYVTTIAACLYMDLRNLILHLVGLPYTAYVSDHHCNGYIAIDDARIAEPVTILNRILWYYNDRTVRR